MYCVIDFETRGTSPWKDDFSVVSCAATNGKETRYADTPQSIHQILLWVRQFDIVVHNASFEGAIFNVIYPRLTMRIACDTMRLTQLFDGGGPGGKLGLKDSASRILGPAKGNWEKPIYDWIHRNYRTAGRESGAFLHMAPRELLEPYNRADVERTYELLQHILIRFEAAKYDWKPDMQLYLYMCNKFSEAKARGILVNRESLAAYVDELTSKIQSIDDSFLQYFTDAVKDVKGILHAKAQAMFKKKVVAEIPKMNPGSTKHLEYLFCEVLKMTPRITTPTGRPCFKTKYLAQWGEGGQILAGRSKAQFTKAQSLALLKLSDNVDKRWHPDLSPGTTVTGRNKTYGGLNILALDRRDKGFMETLLADPGQTLVSVDLVAGEPTVVANFSQDARYRWATVDGVGKKPYFDSQSVLMIDDIYLMFASCTPIGSTAFQNFNADEWLENPEEVKKKYKKIRNLHKVAALGLSYTMGPTKLQKTFFEAGYDYDEDICKMVYNSYWALFSDVKRFSDMLGSAVKRNKHLVNPFGFRCYPSSPRLAFNYFCQSTVNGIMGYLTTAIEGQAPYVDLITTIHDENIYSVPTELVEEFRVQLDAALVDLNRELNWSVPIRCGWVAGSNFYEAK